MEDFLFFVRWRYGREMTRSWPQHLPFKLRLGSEEEEDEDDDEEGGGGESRAESENRLD